MSQTGITLESIFKNRYKELVKYAASFVGNDDAEDVVQNLYIRLHLKNYKIEMVGDLIFLILKRECFSYIDHISRKRKKIKLIGSYYLLSRLSADIDYNACLRGEIDAFIMGMLSCFSEKRRQCIRLYYLCGYSSKEIGSIVNCTGNTVRDHIFQAKKTLKNKITHEDIQTLFY